MKTLWLTSLSRSEDAVRKLVAQLRPYGLAVSGHFWEDDLEKMTWAAPREEIAKPEVPAWLILGGQEDLAKPSVRYGLALLAVTVQAKRGPGYPIVLLHPRGETVDRDSLPTPLRSVEALPVDDPGLAPKLVARVHTPAKSAASEYRLDVYGNPHIGQWFEVGPRGGRWAGALFGVAGGEIAFHGVGPQGRLPNQSVLHYPVKGMKVTLGETEYAAWGVQNEIDGDTSYFVKVKGTPDSILFGPHAPGEDADVFVLATR